MSLNFKQASPLLTENLNSLQTIHNYLEFNIADESKQNLLLAKCKRTHMIFEEYRETYKSINKVKLSDADLAYLKHINDSVDEYYDLIVAFELQLNKIEKSLASPPAQMQDNTNRVKLPVIKLATFDGDLTKWTTFYQMFIGLVDKNVSLSDVEKQHYLLSSLSGEPLSLIKHLPLNNSNYKIALDTLIRRYQDKRLLAASYWQKIFNIEKCTSSSNLRNLITTFSENLSALSTFQLDLWDFTLLQLLLQKLDSNTRHRFETEHADVDIPSYKHLFEFLESQCKAFEVVNLSSTLTKPNTQSSQYRKPQSPVKRHTVLTTTSEDNCHPCTGSHRIVKCDNFLAKPPRERFSFVKENKLCVNCLSSHSLTQCRSQTTCRLCNKKHHTLLHFPTPTADSSDKNSSCTTQEGSAQAIHIPQIVTSAVSMSTVLLSTALVSICDSGGNFHTCRALIDSGSMSCFISERLLNKLALVPFHTNTSIEGIGQTSPSSVNRAVYCHIKPVNRPAPEFTMGAVVLPSICSRLPAVRFTIDHCAHLKGIPLADPTFGTPGEIDVLLGAEIYARIMMPGIRYGTENEPSAFKTVFGWILSGKAHSAPETTASTNTVCTLATSSLENSLKQFWELENVPTSQVIAPEDAECERIYCNTYTRDKAGRYCVALPFVSEGPELGDSYQTALRRYQALERKLGADPALRLEYSKFMQDYLDCGHMSQVEADHKGKYYIPHHAVLKPQNTTSKVRIVYDASAKTSNDKSLNDLLLIGPKLQQDIRGLLLRFRTFPIVLIADIKQMYRQINMDESHCDFQRILYRFDTNAPIQEYRLNTVTYGVSSSPFLAIRTLQQLASDEKQNFPIASEIVAKDTYVDDIVTGCCSIDDAQVYIHPVARTLAIRWVFFASRFA